MNQKEIYQIAYNQSAVDFHCQPEDFLKTENIITYSKKHPQAKKYMQLPAFCQLISYGNNIVAAVDPKIEAEIAQYIRSYPVFRAFEAPQILRLNAILSAYGQELCFQTEYFLPDLKKLKPLNCAYSLKLLGPQDFQALYIPQWSMALCADRAHLDILGIGAYDKETLVGLAACSMDAENMWQIGIDVLPAYRRQNIAASLTSHLAIEILRRDKVPFYSLAWSNLGSLRNALKCGFVPAWIEMGSCPKEISIL